MAVSVLGLHHGTLPASKHHEETDADYPLRIHVGAPRPVEEVYALKVRFTQMGQCAAVVVRKWA
ncbi:MAG: hypothetical protein U0736_19025 [Gemmataceae bacterium]